MQVSSEKVNVLLVDDRAENLLALEAVLGDMSYNLFRAYSGEEALKCLMKEEFAVILLDVQMPGLNGFETAQIIKSRQKTKDIPIIFVTAISKAPENVYKGYTVGAIDYIFKPFEPDILKSKIENFSFIHQTKKGLEKQTELLLEKTRDLEKSNEELAAISKQLLRTEAMSRIVGDTSMDTMVMYDVNFDILSVNPAVKKIFGYNESSLISEKVEKLIPKLIPTETFSYEMNKRYDVTGLRSDGSSFPAEIQLGKAKVDDQLIYACTIRDISELKRNIATLEYQALHDSLTSLPNRTLLYDRMKSGISFTSQMKDEFSLILIDLDDFKTINDTLGHFYGDIMLQEFGNRLSNLVRKTDTLARLGGDEFALFLPIASKEYTMEMVNKILNAIEQPFLIDDHVLSSRLSLGVVFYPDHGEDVEVLMRRADIAMYTAKRTGKDYTVFTAELDTHSIEQLNLIGDLKNALECDDLELYFQPQVNMSTNVVMGAEALLRWIHPVHGFISPDQFIPIAEQAGLMKKLTLWVLEKALQQSRKWYDEGLDIDMSVNLSASDLQELDLPENVQRLLRKYAVKPQAVTLEITESYIMNDPIRARETLKQLALMGIKISIDDFGTGYSSLAYLKNLKVDEIKVDKSFVMDMLTDTNDEIIVRTVINLAHNLGLRVVAEGIESKEVWNKLINLKCDIAQGYYLSAPVPAISFFDWVAERK